MNALKALSIGTISLLSTVAYAQASHAISLSITDAGAGSSTFTFSGDTTTTSTFGPSTTLTFDLDSDSFLVGTGFNFTAFPPTGTATFTNDTAGGSADITNLILDDNTPGLDALDFNLGSAFSVTAGDQVSASGSFTAPVDFSSFTPGTYTATPFFGGAFSDIDITVGAAPGTSVPFEFSPGLGLLAVGGLIGGSRVLKRRKDIIK